MATNAGTQITTQIADAPGYGTVWYDQWAIANIFGSKDLNNYASFMRFAMRSSVKAKYSVQNLGFRCVKTKK